MRLKNLDKKQLGCTATVKIDDEYYPVKQFNISKETDVLDKKHPFLELQ
ncbi:hypothetical protein GF336_00735 [Candidatus Woesearchaeota archaeon]|nr:hypothetical protein [Candidatus Woesearchaeota archaeon]